MLNLPELVLPELGERPIESGETETAIPLLEVLDVLVRRTDRRTVAPLEHRIQTHSAARLVLALVSVGHPGLLELRLNLPVVPQVAVVVSEAQRFRV